MVTLAVNSGVEGNTTGGDGFSGQSASMMETSMVGNKKQSPIVRDIRRYYCEHCGICRSKKSLLRSHILLHHKDKLHEIKFDEVRAPRTTGQKVKHICEECGASFWKPAYLVQHMRSHSVQVVKKRKLNRVEALDPMKNSKMH